MTRQYSRVWGQMRKADLGEGRPVSMRAKRLRSNQSKDLDRDQLVTGVETRDKNRFEKKQDYDYSI